MTNPKPDSSHDKPLHEKLAGAVYAHLVPDAQRKEMDAALRHEGRNLPAKNIDAERGCVSRMTFEEQQAKAAKPKGRK